MYWWQRKKAQVTLQPWLAPQLRALARIALPDKMACSANKRAVFVAEAAHEKRTLNVLTLADGTQAIDCAGIPLVLLPRHQTTEHAVLLYLDDICVWIPIVLPIYR
jgi:hypothetical protein